MKTKKLKVPKQPKLAPHELPNSRVKLKFKKHVLPPLAGFFVAILVLAFLNSQLIAGKIAYNLYKNRSITEAAISTEPVDPSAPPRLKISKINVDAPVIFDVATIDEQAFQVALRRGVVHFPGTAVPGQPGNVAIFGHSSNQWWAPGDYKFVFALLEKLDKNDKIVLEYQGVRYVYAINSKLVVAPQDVSVLKQSTDNRLTLITCTPVGTSAKRLIIVAEQVLPKRESQQNTLPPSTEAPKVEALPSNNPSLWQNIRSFFD